MQKKILLVTAFALSSSFSAWSGDMGDVVAVPASPFYFGAYGGYGTVQGGFEQDGNTPFGRFALGVHAKQFRAWTLGGELGIQSGNTMRLSADQAYINIAGGLPVQATLKPLIDLLFTVKGAFRPDSAVSYLLKGGIAYRQLGLNDRNSDKDSISNVAGEFQAGLGLNVTKNVMLNIFYQGIYSSSNAGVSVNTLLDTTIAHIPTQQAGFLGIEYAFS